MSEFVNLNGIDWEKVTKITMVKEGEKDINIERFKDQKMIRFSQKKGNLILDKEEITLTWK